VYEQHEQRFLALLQRVVDIRHSLEYYKEKALPDYCAACANLGADVWCVVSVDNVGKGTDAEKFRHAMCTINERKEIQNHFFNAVRRRFLFFSPFFLLFFQSLSLSLSLGCRVGRSTKVSGYPH
jgi:hypothetical protein